MKTPAQHRIKIEELDILRSFGFLAVVLQHVIGVFIKKPDITNSQSAVLGLFFNLSKFAVPVFIFITGMVLLYNYQRLDFPSFLRKRARDILLPYFLWTLIYNVYYHGIPSLDMFWIKSLFKDLLLGTGGYHLWFVVMIFQFYLFYPALLWIFNKVKRRSSAWFIPTFLLLTGIGYLASMWFSSSFIPREQFHTNSAFINAVFIKYRDRNSLYWMYYFVLGGIAGVYLLKWREFVSRSAKWNPLLFMVLLSLVTYELYKPETINLNISTSLKPSMFLFTLSYIFLLYGLAVKVKEKLPAVFRTLSLVGQYSFGAYLVHALLLNYVVRFLMLIKLSQFYLLASFLAFVICAWLSVIFVKFISRVPYSSFLVGSIKKG